MTSTTEPALTDAEAEAMLKRLTRHYHEPVQPMSRYCESLQTWADCIQQRAATLRQELFPNLYEVVKDVDPTSSSYAKTERANLQQIEYDASMKATLYAKGVEPTPRDYQLDSLRSYEDTAESVRHIFLQIHKSNLLARLLYAGEKLRTKMCPEHKGHWTGIEGMPESVCPHKCQLTGWIQEEDDTGKPLPGVMAVQMVPTGQAPNEVTMIRSVDGKVLGKAVLTALNMPPKPDDKS